MEIRTSDLVDAALDWAVAEAKGWKTKPWHSYRNLGTDKEEIVKKGVSIGLRDAFGEIRFSPSTDWSQGGPIIHDAGITSGPGTTSPAIAHIGPSTNSGPWQDRYVGPTPLIAAMRCYVAFKLGEKVEVPNEFV